MRIGRGAIARWTAVAAVGMAAALIGSGPAAAGPDGPASLDEVYAQLHIEQVPSDYVMMVDVSGSMRGARYDRLKRSLTEFFAALAPEDRVTLIPFDETATAITQQVGRAPGRLVARLPRDADGSYTDIGAALEKGVQVLGRRDAPALATVVLLTDGRHDPGPNSAYPLTQGHNWDQLAAAAGKLRKTSLEAYAVPLSGATGASLLRKVFPSARILAPTSVDGLSATLARPKAAARAAKARSLLAAEIAKPVAVGWPDGTIGAGRSVLDVRVQSPTPHVPFVLDHLAVRSDNAGVTVTVRDRRVVLPPGGTVSVPVTVDWDAGPRDVAPVKPVRDRVRLVLSAQVSSRWSDVLTKDLGLAFTPSLDATPADRELSAQRGSLWYWIAAAVLLAALVVLVLRWRRGRLSPRLTGAVLIEDKAAEPRTLPLTGRRVLLSADATGLPGNGEITAARAGVGSAEVRLVITYSPDGSAGSRDSAACPPGQTVSVGGTSFTWQAAVPAQRGSSVSARA